MKLKKKYYKYKTRVTWSNLLSFLSLSIIVIVACTNDLDNAGAPLLGPSIGVTVIPQSHSITKAGTFTFAAEGGVTPYSYSISNTDIGTITTPAGLFTALEIAGSATITAVDSAGVSGTATITVLPLQLVVAPGTAVLSAAGDQAFTATLVSGSGAVVCSIARDDSSGTTTIPTVAAAGAVCTVTASAVPASGTETFTVTITDTQDGDVGTAVLTLGTP